jgi:eukaryotic-like serine/threonine-protein kinase
MTPERWRQVKDVLASALERDPGERSRFVAEACSGDPELRDEVESLIRADAGEAGATDSFAASVPAAHGPALGSGARLGPYEVCSLLGAGGMGEVYRARDTKLRREVAIKILPRVFTADPDRLARFEREARLLAALNHPNIGAIYGFEEAPSAPSDGADHLQGLVLELVEGATLADKLAASVKASAHGLAVAEAVGIARQVADALDAAHEKGIVHRDLKPANIKITPDGVVKVLDFGLAKSTGSSGAGHHGPAAAPPPMDPDGTKDGLILGTAGYMSPEQARGRPTDKRTDIWAFGCVLYEMLAGRAAFPGETVGDTLAAVLDREPDWAALPASLPPTVRRLLGRCLEKDPRRRLRDIADARMDLDDATDPMAGPAPAGARRGSRMAWTAAAVCAAVALGLGIRHLRTAPAAAAPPVRFSISSPPNATLTANTHAFVPTLSPDGRRLAFVAQRAGTRLIWVRSLDALEAEPLAGTEGATYPFWSPDSRRLGFFVSNVLKTIEVGGGPARTLCEAPAYPTGGTWSQQGVIVFSGGGLFSVPASGGSPAPLPAAEGRHRLPAFLPDGRRFLYWVAPSNGVWLGSLDSDEKTRLLTADSQAVYAAPGWLLFVRGGTLVAQPFDAARGTLSGAAAPIAEQVVTSLHQAAAFSASQTGTLAYRTGTLAVPTQLTWVDRAGRRLGTVGRPARYRNPALSPDGTRLAVEMTDVDQRTQDLWVVELARDTSTRFTFDPHDDVYAAWSPDGAWIMFGSDRDGMFNLYRKRANGSGGDELVLKSPADMVPYSWTPDGSAVLYRTTGLSINMGILSMVGPRTPRPFLPAPYNVTTGMVSPDGRWVAYQSFESGKGEVYVQSFPRPEGGKWQISESGGIHPRWRGDGRELFYYSVDGRLMAVPIRSDDALAAGAPVPLFEARLLNGGTTAWGFRQQYEVTRDAQRFLLNLPLEEASPPSITVVVDWTALKE